jgi:hypothetical protein
MRIVTVSRGWMESASISETRYSTLESVTLSFSGTRLTWRDRVSRWR